MRKITLLLFFAFILSGCAAYKFQKPGSSGSQGYLAAYNDKPILEYTVGKEKSLPDLAIAKERFKRRRVTVEYYYKKMGLIEGRFKEVFWGFAEIFVDFLGGILRWPFIAAADYKYHHNPEYKKRMDRLDEQKEVSEKERVDRLKERLDAYIAEDLAKELLAQSAVTAAPPAPKPQPEVLLPVALANGSQATVLQPAQQPSQQASVLPSAQESAPQVTVAAPATVTLPPAAVIIAKPAKGYSPLKVNFSGQRSYSKSGKIVSYLWDFGDGDTSTKKNSENTYWSTTYGARNFTVTLTVKDDAGRTSSATSTIEVSTP